MTTTRETNSEAAGSRSLRGFRQTARGYEYRGGVLHVEGVPVEEIATLTGTPTFVYSESAIREAYLRMEKAFAPLGAHLHYAVKACANLNICRLLGELGAGMDVVSGGEMERAWLAGVEMKDIVFAGVAKSEDEIRASLDGRFSPLAGDAERFGRESPETRGPVGILNVESVGEIERISRVARELGVTARVSIRANPNVDPRTHEYTTTGKVENKFGIDAREIPDIVDRFADREELEFYGLHVHIGSPVREVEPYELAVKAMVALIDDLESRGHTIRQLDLGGGWAIDYVDGESPDPEAYAAAITPLLADRVAAGLRVVLEPGRSILANAGVLLTRVQYVKEGRKKRFVICDGGMNVLLRPALYQAFHFVWPARVRSDQTPTHFAEEHSLPGLVPSDVVGPICESSDFLARNRMLPEVDAGSVVAVFSAGAYAMSMASNYNDHGRPAEVLVRDGRLTVINERQRLASLLETERVPRSLERLSGSEAGKPGEASE